MARKRFPDEDADPRWRSDLLPARGELRLIQALLNTKTGQRPEELANPDRLGDWLALWHLLPRSVAVTEDELQRLIEVRGGLRRLALARTAAARDQAASVLDVHAKAVRVRLRFDTDGRVRYEPAGDDFEGTLARIFQIVLAAQSDDTWLRLKICPEKTCGRAFYDFSKNRSGRWCQQKCGNRSSARDYRQRYGRY